MLRKVSFLLLLFVSLQATDDYYIVFLVNARNLDYSSSRHLLKTIAKHPSDWSKNGDVGHAWIYLSGPTIIEGGHSGELGIEQPRYMDGVMDNMALGAKNPISYLWCSQCDGFFQGGNGGHAPTFAAKISLSSTQYEAIYAFICSYPYENYSLTNHQCCDFVREIGALAGIALETHVTVKLDPIFWEDSAYEYLTFGTPDRLEKSLKALVKEGRMENVLPWYQRTHRKCFFCWLKEKGASFRRFPERYARYLEL